MKIEIKYESSWRNSFLEGSNNEPLPKDGRKFIGSMTSLKKSENYIARSISHNTVMGILNRLIGDQRKLYQARQQESYYFQDIEPLVSFSDKPIYINQEMTFIRNISGSTEQSSYAGMIYINHPMLISDYSKELWGVLSLTFENLCEFIINEAAVVNNKISTNPITLVEMAEALDKEKNIEITDFLSNVAVILTAKFPDLVTDKMLNPFVENNGKIKLVRFYAAALYIQLERLKSKYDMTTAVTKSCKVAGFSRRGFNGKRDFMKNFVTGGEKKVWGNPYVRKEKIKGIGEVTSLMEKAGGELSINLAVLVQT